jgi:23S rRNA (cytidine1920-2'-O)/16S rRNA (cytidine1409-2'-O)-methyltransferase
MKTRLDIELTKRGLVTTRSQAESYIKLGVVMVDDRLVTKTGFLVDDKSIIKLNQTEQYVSRAGLKLASVAHVLKIDFISKVVLDVGSSTGGFTDFALTHGAKKVYAIDVGTNQLHPSLRTNDKIELHEQTNILDVFSLAKNPKNNLKTDDKATRVYIKEIPEIIVIDVSFVSLRDILPHIAGLCSRQTIIIAMCKPQFEAGYNFKQNGVIKNDAMRRKILQDFEQWLKRYFVLLDKADSNIRGAKGNLERFYKLSISK